MIDTYRIVRDFEAALCEYTGARYAVTTTSCTMALLLACAYHRSRIKADANGVTTIPRVIIPKHTYVSVPMSIRHAGFTVGFRDEEWSGYYRLDPLPVVDSARYFTHRLYDIAGWKPGMWPGVGAGMVCVSFHWSKSLGIQQGGCILHDDPEADAWLRRARFDGRTEGVAPKDDTFPMIGWHAYMSPETAAAGLMRLALLPKHNDPLPNDPYPDLSQLAIFK